MEVCVHAAFTSSGYFFLYFLSLTVLFLCTRGHIISAFVFAVIDYDGFWDFSSFCKCLSILFVCGQLGEDRLATVASSLHLFLFVLFFSCFEGLLCFLFYCLSFLFPLSRLSFFHVHSISPSLFYLFLFFQYILSLTLSPSNDTLHPISIDNLFFFFFTICYSYL